MSNPSRTRARNRLYLVGVLPAVLMLLVSGRIALLLHDQLTGLSAFDAERYAVARDAFARNQVANPFEPWLAHFDEGAARYRAGDATGAVVAYEEALDEGVPTAWRCPLRNNLALAHEALGDAALAAGDRVAAEASWLTGRQALASCLPADDAEPDEAAADTDGDGVVSAEEAAAAAEALADTDGDGVVTDEERAAAQADRDRDGVVSASEAATATTTVIDRRLADKLDGSDSSEPTDPAEPTPRDETAEERQQRLDERNRRALEQRLRAEQEREERADSRPDPGGDPQEPPTPAW